MSRAARKLVCLGFGYCARALARAVAGEFREVVGTARRADRARALLTDGFAVLPFDAPGLLDGATHLLISAPPEAEGDPVLAALGDAIAGLSGIAWIGYLSTTGVYGDRRGGWVSEDDAPNPGEARSTSRLAAERAWLAFGDTQDAPVHIFRLAGIYGPGRNALDRLRAGTARRIVKPGQVFSRVHVEDVAKVLQASIARPQTGRVYNIADDEPASQEEVVAFAAGLLGIAPPPEEPFESAELSPLARSFYSECRRVRNDRIKQELGVVLRYPTYREGLIGLAAL